MNFASAARFDASLTFTENGAKAHSSTGSACVDFFGIGGSLRSRTPDEIFDLFLAAYHEDPLTALRILFYIRDIRGGLGERDTFRIIMGKLAQSCPSDRAAVRMNMRLIPE